MCSSDLPDELTGLGVALVSLEYALSTARVVVLLVDHAEFRAAKPIFSHAQRIVDTKGTWKKLPPS